MSGPNDPAYPLDDGVKPCYGLTIRQEFVKAAMQGLIIGITRMSENGIIQNRPQDVSELACLYADTALAEEARTKGDR